MTATVASGMLAVWRCPLRDSPVMACHREALGEAIMTLQALLIWLIVGALAGWIAGLIVKGYGFGLIGNIIVGIIGALIAGWLLPRLGVVIGGDFVGSLINAIIGAIILLVIIGLIRR
jgi:uncharacterized membrane protein YeaQ/YmgE (transglycosylase-associated protein family)